MGGAIARGIAHSTGYVLTVSSPNRHGELDSLKSQFQLINVSTHNVDAALGADIIIIAVKPWLIDTVMEELKGAIDRGRTIICLPSSSVTRRPLLMSRSRRTTVTM